MILTLLASHNEQLYKAEVCGVADVADLVGDNRLQSLSSSDGTIDYWFSRPDPRVHVNLRATQLLLATTRFTAHQVPLLHGPIVIASHDSDGKLASLTDEQFTRLINAEPSWRENFVLARRFNRDVRAARRARNAKQTAARKPRLPLRY